MAIELPDLHHAKAEAVSRIRRMLNHEAASGIRSNLDRVVQITNDDGELLATITFREAAGL